MPSKLTQTINAVYSIADIKALIVADMAARGFKTVDHIDVKEPWAFDDRPYPADRDRPHFEGFEIRLNIDVPEPKPVLTTRGG